MERLHGNLKLAKNEFRAMLTVFPSGKTITIQRVGHFSQIKGNLYKDVEFICSIQKKGSTYSINFESQSIEPYELMAAHDLLFKFDESVNIIKRQN